MESDRCAGADTSHTKTDDFAPNDSYEIGHNELIIFGDSRNDESSLMNSVLMDMLENQPDSEKNSKKSSEGARPAAGEQARDHSKKGLKKSTSKKRASQSNLFRPASGQKRTSKTPIGISTVLQDMVQRKKELTLSEIDGLATDREARPRQPEETQRVLTGSSKHIALVRADSASSRHLHSGLRANLKDSDFFQSYLNTKNSRFSLEEPRPLQDRTDAALRREAAQANANAELGSPAPELRVNLYEKKQPKQPQKSVHPTLLSVITSIDQHETQKLFIHEKMTSDQKHPRLVKAGSEADATLASKRVLATRPPEDSGPLPADPAQPLPPKTAKRPSAANSQSKKPSSLNKENSQPREDSAPAPAHAGSSQDKPAARRREAKSSTQTLDNIFKQKPASAACK